MKDANRGLSRETNNEAGRETGYLSAGVPLDIQRAAERTGSLAKTVDVLIVDDREDGLIALEAVLSDSRIRCIKANSGIEALTLLPHHEFAVILLDVQMPDMDGFETAAHIRSLEKFRHVPIIFVTAINKDDRYIYRGYESGAVDYVFKPFDPQILRSKVSVFVDLYAQQRVIREQESRLIDAERDQRIRQLAELELESLRRYRHLADSIPHIVVRTRPDSTPDYFNRVWTEYTGISLEASIGDGWHRAMHGEDLPAVLRCWLDALISGTSFEAECRIRRFDGEYRWHLIRAVPERRACAEVIGWTGTATDIHDRKLVETDLRRAMTEAEQASITKTQFLANMSHEIRTPLSAILGFSELLLTNKQTSDERTQGLTTIRRNGEQLLHLINEILDISKVESGKLEIERVKVDVATLLGELRASFELKASEKGLKFSISCTSDVPARIWTDPVRVRQIVSNILSNAVKFTSTGAVDLILSFDRDRMRPEMGQLRFIIRDSGIGVPADRIERLFQPFVQADSSTTRKYGGTGLGLALSQKLARKLGGDVHLTRSDENGSEFNCWIACQSELLSTIPKGEIVLKWTAPTPVDPSSESTKLKGFRILVVDDAPDNQVLISRFLKMGGAEVHIAGNGSEGVDRARETTYDLILMDIQMPGMDGYSATKILRDEGFVCPIIALTAHALTTERARCLSSGFDDHLSKPIDKRRLIYCVRDWIDAKGPCPTGAESSQAQATH